MAFFTKSLQRKLLGILLLVGFGPAVVGLAYNLSVFSLGFERVLGGFLQDRADIASGKLDDVLHGCFAELSGTRDSLVSGNSLAVAAGVPSRFAAVYVTDHRGAVLEASPATSETRVEVLPGLTRATTSSEVLLNETLSATGESRLLFQAIVDDQRLLSGVVDANDVFRASGETIGSAFLRVYSNRGVFPNQSEDFGLQQLIAQRGQQIRQQLGGWLATSDRKTEPGALVGFAASKLLQRKRNEGLTSVEWITFTRMDVQEVTSLMNYMMWKNLLFALALTPLLVGLSVLLARRFLAPVRAIHKQARRIARGDMDARAEVYTGDEMQQLAMAFNQMAESLRSSRDSLDRYLQSVEKKARQISVVSSISKNLTGPFDLNQLFRTTTGELRSLLQFEGVTLVIFGDAMQETRRFWSAADVFEGSPDSEVQSVCEAAFAKGTRFPACLQLESPAVKALADLVFEQCCVVPLRTESGVAGVLALGRRAAGDFTGEECIALEQIGDVLAVAVEHIGLYERTRIFATELEQMVEERAAELQRAQEQLFRSERFAATGRLAANIAHEINNPLGVIKNYLHLFRVKQSALDPASVEALNVVQEELDRIARIVRNLLDFYRPAAAVPEHLNLNEEIRQIMPLVEAGFRRRAVKLEMELSAENPVIEAPRDQLRQMLLNLLKNAEEAVEEHGCVTVRTRTAAEDGNATAVLEVADNGCGIAAEDQAQVFEPFFTRKTDGQGTGLGLAVTYSIVQSLHGSIELESTPGEGTTFRILLPCTAAHPLTA